MTMITLNIISDKQRLVIQAIIRYKLIKRICYSSAIIIALVCLLLAASYFLLDGNLNNLNKQIVLAEEQLTENGKAPNTKESIDRINKKLNRLKKIQDEYTKISPIVQELTKTIPEGVDLSVFNINIKDNAFEISGTSPDRQTLLILQDQLENSKTFTEVDSPLSNLLHKENITFRLTGKINQ